MSPDLSDFGRPFGRTFAYFGRASGGRRRERFGALGIPLPDSSAGIAAFVGLDELALASFSLMRPGPDREAWGRIGPEAAEADALFTTNGWLDPHSYLGDPPPLVTPDTETLSGTDGHLTRMRFPSGWEPRPSEPGAERWNAYEANRTAWVHVLRHPGEPRPWVVWLHGSGMGRLRSDMRVLGAQHLHEDLGVNIALPILPLHGRRQEPRESRAEFPSIDVLDDVHGLAQAAWDVRRVLSWVRAQEAPSIALAGLSLGGYVAALVAGLEPPLDALIACVPAADFPKVFDRHLPRRVREREEVRVASAHSDRLHRAVSPLRVVPATPADRRFILASTADRLLDPVEQAGALWEHWDRPAIHWLSSGHISHPLRQESRDLFEAALRSTGIVETD